MLPNSEYWIKRTEQNLIAQEQKADDYILKLKKAYEQAKKSLEMDLSVFYMRYASDNSISYLEAQKLLSGKELQEFKENLKKYISLAKSENLNPVFIKKLENMSIRARVRRIEALKIEIENKIETLSSQHNNNTADVLSEAYSDSYYKSIWTVQTGLQLGVKFDKLNKDSIQQAINTAWLEENYSDRIYKDKKKLIQTLEIELQQSFIRGDSIQNTAKRLYKRLDVSYNNAVRLVRTETNHISNEASFNGYKASKLVQRYEFVATLDLRTSEFCSGMDNKNFALSEKQVGVNFPPLHTNCRSTTIPFFNDDVTTERIARGVDGKTYSVGGNISYKDWFNKYVV